jgi:hypothetical protein
MLLNSSLNTHNHHYTLTILERQHQVVELKVIEYNKAENAERRKKDAVARYPPHHRVTLA